MMPMNQQMMPPPFYGARYIPKQSDFPQEIQQYFKTKNIGFVKFRPKRNCRKLDPIISSTVNYIDKFAELDAMPVPKQEESKAAIKKQIKLEKLQQNNLKNAELLKSFNPFTPSEEVKELVTMDPYKTLFVSRLNKAITEKDLHSYFKYYGKIKKMRIVIN